MSVSYFREQCQTFMGTRARPIAKPYVLASARMSSLKQNVEIGQDCDDK